MSDFHGNLSDSNLSSGAVTVKCGELIDITNKKRNSEYRDSATLSNMAAGSVPASWATVQPDSKRRREDTSIPQHPPQHTARGSSYSKTKFKIPSGFNQEEAGNTADWMSQQLTEVNFFIYYNFNGYPVITTNDSQAEEELEKEFTIDGTIIKLDKLGEDDKITKAIILN